MTEKYVVSIFGEEKHFTDKEQAISEAQHAERTYANGFVQVHDSNGSLIYGLKR